MVDIYGVFLFFKLRSFFVSHFWRERDWIIHIVIMNYAKITHFFYTVNRCRYYFQSNHPSKTKAATSNSYLIWSFVITKLVEANVIHNHRFIDLHSTRKQTDVNVHYIEGNLIASLNVQRLLFFSIHSATYYIKVALL